MPVEASAGAALARSSGVWMKKPLLAIAVTTLFCVLIRSPTPLPLAGANGERSPVPWIS